MGNGFGKRVLLLKIMIGLRLFLFDGVTVVFLAVFLSIGAIESN